jgi:DNA-binding MarR family transcriptional regulator
MVTMMSLGRRLRNRFPDDQVDFSALPILKALWHGGPMRLSALAAALDLDASTVSRHVRHLEERGMLERTGDPDDGRASRVTLTEQGTGCMDQAVESRRAMIRELLDGWPAKDRERLRTLLTRLYTDLSTSTNPQENS